jgi:hypothetical protein
VVKACLIYGVHDLHEGHIFWNETEVLGPKYNLVPECLYKIFISGF